MATLNKSIETFNIPYITSVRYINDPNEGIAKSRRSTGELVINKYYFFRLPKEHQLFVLLHEAGHIAHNTRDELTADKFASDVYLNAGFPISESVKALACHLQENNPVHIARAWAQYQRALEFDYRQNNNQKTFRPHYDSIPEIKQNLKVMVAKNTYAPEWTPFLGIAIGKKARQRKQEKFDTKMATKAARAANINSKAQSRFTLAEQGIVMPSGGSAIGSALQGAAGLVGNLTGMGQIGSVLQSAGGANPEPGQSLPDLMTQLPPAIYNTGDGRSMGSMTGDSTTIPNMATQPFAPVQNDTSNNTGTDAKKKNTNMLIFGVVGVAVLALIFFLIRK